MHDTPTLKLRFGESVESVIRRRISYAFKLFCAVYGYRSASEGDCPALCYGAEPIGPRDIALTTGYVARSLSVPAPAPREITVDGDAFPEAALGVRFPCFHEARGGTSPDWLGEIFEWVSGAHEYSVQKRDSAGRIPFASTLHGRYGLNPAIPYASAGMRGLNRDLRAKCGSGWPLHPTSPWPMPQAWAVAATHDCDFLPVSVTSSLFRFCKNAAISALRCRNLRLTGRILGRGLGALLGGPSLGNCLRRMIAREQETGIRSSYNLICRCAHPRDANYSLDNPSVARVLNELVQQGAEIAVHGSYTSLDAPGRLQEEYRWLAEKGISPVGGRQHWLKYRGPLLFEELSRIGAWYDTTAGYSGQIGFRHGAAFPFPPYDFKAEAPFPLLELPLAIMDSSLYDLDQTGRSWSASCQRVLSASRHYGWGGFSILWHDTVFSGAQLPIQLADLYWQLKRPEDAWMRARDIAEKVWPRYAQVGLLPLRREPKSAMAIQEDREMPVPVGILDAGRWQPTSVKLLVIAREI
jgi:hypothetical protein